MEATTKGPVVHTVALSDISIRRAVLPYATPRAAALEGIEIELGGVRIDAIGTLEQFFEFVLDQAANVGVEMQRSRSGFREHLTPSARDEHGLTMEVTR